MVQDMLGHRMDIRVAVGDGGDIWASAWVQTPGCVSRMQARGFLGACLSAPILAPLRCGLCRLACALKHP